jgi:hypothetical protein
MAHFEREAKINAGLLAAMIRIPIVLTLVVGNCYLNSEAVKIDRCLDKGGSYKYENGDCDFDVSHPAP